MTTARIGEIDNGEEFPMQKLLALATVPDNELSPEQMKERTSLTQILTGSALELVNQHASFIKQHGREQWLAQCPEDRIFDFDGTAKSIPARD